MIKLPLGFSGDHEDRDIYNEDRDIYNESTIFIFFNHLAKSAEHGFKEGSYRGTRKNQDPSGKEI